MTDIQEIERRITIETCLKRVLESSGFAKSDRMRDFLTYVVEESLAGRGNSILGKTIAQDVYGRTADEDGDTNNVVRVEARRLRRCLAEYYQTKGLNDQIRIHIDSGGYVPRFEVVSIEGDQARPTGDPVTVIGSKPQLPILIKTGFVIAALFGFVLLVALGYILGRQKYKDVTNAERMKTFERQALLEKSHKSLQAANLAEQARGMIFPLFDVERQKLTTELFKQAIQLDSGYFGGYAGAAQTLSSLAILAPQKAAKDAYLEEAKRMIAKAVDLTPTHAWTQASLAWVSFASKEYDQALRISKRATELAPLDAYILDTRALILLFTGDFEGASEVSNPAIRDGDGFERSGYRNIFAAANFHLGFYKTTLKLFEQAGRQGGPISPPKLAYEAAANSAIGDVISAGDAARKLKDSWPKSRVDEILLSFFKNPEHAKKVIDPLTKAGWSGGD